MMTSGHSGGQWKATGKVGHRLCLESRAFGLSLDYLLGPFLFVLFRMELEIRP